MSERVPQQSWKGRWPLGYYALFSAMFGQLHSVTNAEQYEKQLCRRYRKYGRLANTVTGKPHHRQQKELEHKGGQRQVYDVSIVCTAVGKKAYLGTKLHQAVKKSSS